LQSHYPYHSFGRNPQEELEKFTVQISRLDEEAALGTGILVTNDGLIATCYHVVKSVIKSRSAGSSSKKKYATVSFSDGAIRLEAEILEQYCKENLDVAILKIDQVPEGYEEAKLGIRIYDYLGHHFVSRGYRKNERYSHLPSNGIISDVVYSKDWSSYVIRLESTNYGETGMSGSAVYDVDLNQGLVVGMMRFHDEDEKGVDDKAPYAILVSDIIKCCPAIQEKNRGLVVYEFLNIIQSHNSESYKNIDHLWVAPKEYYEMIKTVERDRLVIITGPPEYGKTYAAIRSLWEYYHHKGYLPILFDMEDRRWDRAELQEKINQIISFISENNKQVIIYLNDPFGKTDYIDQYIDDTRNLINSLRRFKNSCLLIISSREKNFESVSDPFLREIESIVRFDISKPSYDPKMKEQILLMHAKNSGCAWLDDATLTNSILDLIRNNQRMLPTLLNIFDFVQETVDEKDFSKLKKKMNIFSEYTPIAFAKEIRREHYDLMEFLSFPFIARHFDVSFVRSQYEELIKDRPNRELYEFDKVSEKFKDKISIEGYVNFRHPSYSEALPFVLERENATAEDRHKPNTMIESFLKVIFKLADNRRTAGSVADFISHRYYKLPPDVQKLLFKLADNRRTAGSVAYAISYNYNKLPPDVQKLIFKLVDSRRTSKNIARFIAEHYDMLPPDIANQLLIKLADNREVSVRIVSAILDNYNKLPEEVQRLIFKLAATRKVFGRERVQRLETLETIASYLAEHYDKLPPHIANQLLIKLAETETSGATTAIANNYNKLPEEVQKLLFKLADNEDTGNSVLYAIASNYNKLPEEVQRLIFKLADKTDILSVWRAATTSKDLPQDIKDQLISKLKEKDFQNK